MKTATLSPALESIREVDVLISKSALPKLSYRRALDSYVITGAGVVRQVAECSPDEMNDLVLGWLLSAKNPKGCQADLAGLDYRHMVDRWYALDTLRLYGAAHLLFASAEEAEASLVER